MDRAASYGQGPARRGSPAWRLVCSLVVGFGLTVGLPVIGPTAAVADEVEPRVARVGHVEGEASYLNADADEWTAVEVNAPLVTGDRFYSGPGGRAEIQLPGGIDARLASETEIALLDVSDRAVQVRVGIGTATFRVRSVPANVHVELSTPTTALVARARGVYRVDVAQDGQTTVQVREGEVDAYVGDERYRLDEGRGARIVDASYVTGDAPAFEAFDATVVAADPWDDWERARAGRLQSAASYQYVDDEVYGVADLDEYGSWDRHVEYGPIWRPTRVAAGWAPFTQGRWVWQDPWGWTWVDYEPWGWAPSHHGRWVYVQDAWAWAPGPVVARPVYAPATVGFLGVSVSTPSVSVSVGIGPSVGWVPLGWGEPIVPWWGGFGGVRRGSPYWGGWGGPRIVNNKVIQNTSITNINVTNINYTNIDRPRGFTAVSRESFVRGDLQRVDLPPERVRELARPLRGAPDVLPQRDSLFAARPEKLRAGRTVKPAPEVVQRAALSTRAVPASRPSFERKLERIQREGAPVAPRELRQMARERGDDATPVRTVSSRGKKPIVPELTARAAGGSPVAGVATPAESRGGADREPDRAATRKALPGRADTTREAMPGRADTARASAGGQQQAERVRADRAERAAAEQARRDPAEPRATSPQAERARREATARKQSERDTAVRQAQREEATRRETAARQERATQERERAQTDRRQREQAERVQRDAMARQQRDAATRQQQEAQQRERARAERTQRQQAERTQAAQRQRTAERTQAQRQRATERTQAAQSQRATERTQAAQGQRAPDAQRPQAEGAQREPAPREQQRVERQRERAPDRQSMQRKSLQRQAPARDEQAARSKERRAQQRGAAPDA